MQMNDMVIISVDDHICEPPTLFDKQLSGDLLASAPKLKTDERSNVQGRSGRRPFRAKSC